MLFKKSHSVSMPVKALNTPEGWEEFVLPAQIKTASTNKLGDDEDLGGFDLKEATKEYPDNLYIKIFAIKKDEVNDNGDAFSAKELKKAADTFVGVPLFTNHQNDDIEKARGECVHSWYDEDAGGIYIIGRVDKLAYPKLARGIEQNIIKGTSMGTSVEYSCCSVCHNFAKTADSYCTHVKERKNRKYSGDIKCKYFDNKDAEGDKCPVCSSTKDDLKTLTHKEQQIFEHNYGLKFIENSFVVNPACHECGVTCILNTPEVEEKVAKTIASINNVLKYANDTEHQDNITKMGGVKELQSLKNSMTELEGVIKSMLEQKENVSMEYVSEIVKAMADIQGTYDELNEMGYGKLPSPQGIQTADAGVPDINAFPDVAEGVPTSPQLQPQLAPTGDGGYSSSDMGGLGTVTKPKLSHNMIKKIKDFTSENKKITNKLYSFRDNLSKLNKYRRNNMADIVTQITSSDGKQLIISKEDDSIFVTEAKSDDILKVSNINQFSEEVQELIKSNPEAAARKILETTPLKETGADMSTTTKVAADLGNQEIITEKQLEKKQEPLHPRTDEVYEAITESKEQIGRTGDLENVTTSDTPQHRRGTYETITQDQLDKVNSGYITRWDDMLDVITEKQWDDMSRLVSANIPSDYTEVITDKQLRQLLSNHTYCGPVEVITEKQFSDRVNFQELNRWASKDYAKNLVKTATSVIADAVAKFDKSIEEIGKVASHIKNNPNVKQKVIALTLINNLPWKKEDRVKIAEDFSFNKLASKTNDVTAIDAFIVAVADHAQFPQKAEDVFDAISQAMTSKKAMSQIQDKIKVAKEDNKVKITKQADAIDSAIKELDRPEDGKYRLMATMADIKADPKDKVAFHAALNKFAQEMIDDEGVAAAIIKVQVGEDGSSLIIDIEDGGAESIAPNDIGDFVEGPVEDVIDEVVPEIDDNGDEKEDMHSMEGGGEMQSMESEPSLAGARAEIKKQAQMMGGELGGQGGVGQGPGAGATLPQPPADPASQPALETFNDEGDFGGDEEFDEDCEVVPPGTVCVACTSKDVDVVDGKAKCNCCGAEMNIKVAIEVTKWPGVTPDAKKGGEDEEGDIGEGEGFELPEGEDMGMGAGGAGGGMETAPAMASVVKMNPSCLHKLAEIQEKAKTAGENKEKINKLSKETGIASYNLRKMATKVIKPGSISPETGNTNTLELGDGEYMCLATGTKYKVAFVTSKKGESLYGQWEWTPKLVSNDCPTCSRAKQGLFKALASANVKKEDFMKMNVKSMVSTIKKLKEAGKLTSIIKTASKEGSIIEDYKTAYGNYGEKFPMENCVEKIARRFGSNALALSGPCEGKNLADCLCSSLKKAGVYSDKVAYKVASAWSDCDGDEECITHQVREGYDLREASAVCEALKVAVASPVDLFASELKVAQEFEEITQEGPEEVIDEDPFDDEAIPGEENMIEDEVEGGEVTITLPSDVAEELKTELETATGGDIEGELNEVPTDEGLIEDTVPVDDGSPEEVVGPDDLSPMEGGGEMNSMEDGGCESVTPEEGVVFDEDEEGNNKGNPSQVTVNDNTSGSKKMYMSSDKEGYSYKEASYMSSKVGKTGQMGLDLESVAKALNKEAGEKQVEHKNVQDVSEIGTYSAGEGGSQMGHENETIPSAGKPSVPRDKSLMGQEAEDLNPQDGPQPVIPSDKATMGHEDEQGLAGGDHSYTGGVDGAGKTETASVDEDIFHMKGFGNSSDALGRLAKRILEAGDKKLESPAPVADDKDIQPISGTSTMGKEEALTLETPQNVKGSGNASQMGHENESIGDRPDSPGDHPSIPADNALMGQEDQEIGPEKQTKNKGTVIADNSDAESEAYRVAGRMLEAGKIPATELRQKVAELSAYKPAIIRDIEKSIFVGEKGLDTVSDGKLAQAVIINEASNQRNSQDDLSTKLAGLFTIERQNLWADSDEGTQLRKTFGRN
jgi:hypothetical protein